MHTPNLSAHVLVAAGVGAPASDGEAEVAGVTLVGDADVVAEVGAGADDRAATATTTVPAVRTMASAPTMTPIRRGARRLEEGCSSGVGSSI
jgi:hypothetical protein